MPACRRPHPERPELHCVLPATERGHRDHVAVDYSSGRAEHVLWPDPEFRARPEDTRTFTAQAAALMRSGPATLPPLITKTGRRTRLGQVANLLVNHVGEWLDGARFSAGELEGSDGLRRLRQLEEDYGWRIEERPSPAGPGRRHQYRLVELPDNLKEPSDDQDPGV